METVTQSAGTALPSANATQTGPSVAPSGLPPLPMRAGHLPLADVIDLFMHGYTGRDKSKGQRLKWWSARLGAVTLQDLSDDHVHAAIEDYAGSANTYFAGRDARGQPILKARKRPLRPASVNRMLVALSGVLTWCIKRRIAPKGWAHPCRGIDRRPEDNERTRYLSEDERTRLLEACRASDFDRLYLLVLMAITTGARRGELLGLRWADVDLQRGEALLAVTKNGERRVLVLVPAVVEELKRFKAGASSLIFCRPKDPQAVYSIEGPFRRALEAARIRGATFHTLRHTAASVLAMNGATLLEIADVLGHRQLTVTRRYSHLSVAHKSLLIHRILGDMR